VNVDIDETRQHEATAGVDDSRVGAGQVHQPSFAAHGHDATTSTGYRFG